MSRRFVERLARAKFEMPSSLRDILQLPQPPSKPVTRRKRHPQAYLKVVNNGYYFRIKLPPKKNSETSKTSHPTTIHSTNLPKKLTPSQAMTVAPPPPPTFQTNMRRFLKWVRANLPVMILNFGSVCILVGFSRSDVIELRSLTMTGQLTFAIYNLAQATVLWPSVAWSTTFATVNAIKIYDVFHERTAEVNMSEEQEQIFVTHFMPHGITPKQFERIEQKAEKVKLKKGDYLIRKGDPLDHLFLVVEGSTHAHMQGRSLVAASTYDASRRGDQLEGGDSGAWIGELTFLDRLWEYEQGLTPESSESPKPGLGRAMYTIVADDDCVVMSWSHNDMTDLMESSKDLKAAMTRAMTSAVVAKVINLSVTHGEHGRPNWTRWLSDWGRNDGTEVHILDKLKAPQGREN